MSFQVVGITLHLYGLIVGIAVSIGLYLAEFLAKKEKIAESLFWRTVITMICGAVVGARLWHVMTDWSLYQHNLERIPQVWNGGLSIIGAIVGGILTVVLFSFFVKKNNDQRNHFLAQAADIAALVLPISQAIGRLGNYINQELYGLPTSLPWGIFIEERHRSAPFLDDTFFHPLFAYEAIGTLFLAAILWYQYLKGKWQVGSAQYFLLYLSWYGLFRGVLEFLRVDKALFELGLGVNQTVLFAVGGVSCIVLLILFKKDRSHV